MIDRVRFRNFKALREVDVSLDRLTVLYGPNAAGKTAVLEGIHHLTRLTSTEAREVFRGPADVGLISSRGASGTFELALGGIFRGKRGSLSVSFSAIEDYPFTDTYRLTATWADQRHAVTRELGRAEGGEEPAAADIPLGLVMREAAMLRLDARRLAEPAFSELKTPLMSAEGDGLAAVIADLAVSRPDDFRRVQEALRAVVPNVQRVRLVRAPIAGAAAASELDGATSEGAGEVVWGHEVVLDMRGAADIPARAASEGTLLLLGLFTALVGPERHHVVLIDHLERAVSAPALGPLVNELYQLLEADPKLQIVATTDSPLLLNHVRAEDVRVHALLPDGSVTVAPLDDHPDWEMLKQDLRPGEFLNAVGEDWGFVGPNRPPSRFPLTMPPLPTDPRASR